MYVSNLTTLGGFAFEVNRILTRGPATRKARALMAFLIMTRNADSARERLIEIFWPDVDTERARASLSTALHSIRRCLRTAGVEADTFLLATKSVVRWTAETTLDALQFAELAAREEEIASQEALQLYHGDFLEGDYDDWAAAERERLAALYETVLARIVRSSKDSETAQRFIARNPYDEEAYTAIVEAELTAGRRSSAAAWVERCRKALSEVGENPSSSFETRFGRIAHIEPLVPDELALPFAGRETELALLAARLGDAATRHGSATLVHGEAGIGKSTLLVRVAHLATENGLRVLVARCGDEVSSTFGPWQKLFGTVGAGDFETFVRAHPGKLATAVAQAIAARLTELTALIVDDAHELKGEALDIFLALAQEVIPEHAIIVAIRPEGVSLLRSRLADVPFDELPLGRLDRDNLKWALEVTLGREQPDLLKTLYDRTGGHPLFFTGLLNSLVSAGALVRSGHRWQLTKAIDNDLELPDSVRRFIDTRLHARGEAPHAVACALALEPAANSDDIASVLRFDESTTLDALDDLLALGLIAEPASGAPFAFTHGLIREVAALGLNAGRRRSLHRAFAERLRTGDELETSLRLARHLEAAGEAMASAQSYLKSAEEALEMNAAQDAIDRCDSGARELQKLERAANRDVLLARLHRTASRAEFVRGNSDEAVRRSRDAARLARSGGDLQESTKAVLDLAAMEGATLDISEQRSDAATAVENARLCLDDALEAQALIQQASAACELGLRDEALRAGRSAYGLAVKCARSDIMGSALEELLRAQLTWWLFSDSLETARTGLDAARQAEPFAQASFLYVRAALWYLLERFDESETDLQAALHITNDIAAWRHVPVVAPLHPQPFLQFACYYMAGKLAVAREQWDRAIDAVDKAGANTIVAKLPRHGEAISLLRIDALLRRGLPGDGEAAYDLTTKLAELTRAQGIIGWSDCVELARARVAARLREPDAGAQLTRAVDALEENAHRSLLDTDLAFARLAEAASEVDEVAVALRARARSKFYKSRRLASAGAAWGGSVHDSEVGPKMAVLKSRV